VTDTRKSQWTVVASALHSLYPFRVIGGSKYVVYAHGTVLKLLNLATKP
jgi:hypothetical protein